MSIDPMAKDDSSLLETRDGRFLLMRAFRALCTDRGYTSADVQRSLGGDDVIHYQTVAGWGVTSRHRRQQRNTPSARWLSRIIQAYPEIKDGVYRPSHVVLPKISVAQVTRGIPRDELVKVVKYARSALGTYVIAERNRGEPWPFASTPAWRYPADHFNEMPKGTGLCQVPVVNFGHLAEQLGCLLYASRNSSGEEWLAVLEIKVDGRDSRIPCLAVGGSDTAEDKRRLIALALGFYLVGDAASGNAKHAAALHFADELLVPSAWLMLWLGRARSLPAELAAQLAELAGVKLETIERQCARNAVSLIAGGKRSQGYLQHMASL